MELIFKIIGIIVTWYIADRLAESLIGRLRIGERIPAVHIATLQRVGRFAIAVFALMFIGEISGFAPGDMWRIASTVFALVAVGFIAYWSALSNHVCGLVILFTRPFRVGDRIQLFDPSAEKGGITGKVVDISPVYTVLDENGSAQLFIPHNLVLQRGVRVLK